MWGEERPRGWHGLLVWRSSIHSQFITKQENRYLRVTLCFVFVGGQCTWQGPYDVTTTLHKETKQLWFNKYRMFERRALKVSYLIRTNFWVICMANSLFKFMVYVRYSWKTYRCRAGKEITVLHGTRIYIIVVTKAPPVAHHLSQPNLMTQIIPYLIRAGFKHYLGLNLWIWIINNKSSRTALFSVFTKRRMVISYRRLPSATFNGKLGGKLVVPKVRWEATILRCVNPKRVQFSLTQRQKSEITLNLSWLNIGCKVLTRGINRKLQNILERLPLE